MWVGGPPNPMIPMRLHSRTMVESGTLTSAESVMVGVVVSVGTVAEVLPARSRGGPLRGSIGGSKPA